MYYVENNVGEDMSGPFPNLDAAVDNAKWLLEDDPERGSLNVIHYTHERTVTFGPDANWNTQVVVLKPGERLSVPAAFKCSPKDVDESCGYLENDPKHPDFHSVHADLWDLRAGK